jgi:hypothetical protein
MRDERLNVTQFRSIDDAAEKFEDWRIDYNGTGPHSLLGKLTPSEFARKRPPNGEGHYAYAVLDRSRRWSCLQRKSNPKVGAVSLSYDT